MIAHHFPAIGEAVHKKAQNVRKLAGFVRKLAAFVPKFGLAVRQRFRFGGGLLSRCSLPEPL